MGDAQKDIAKYGGKVDMTEWAMPPSSVNAYYSPDKNEMVFPAGILQPPFFNKDQPMVLNFAAIGSVMGHELTHGFDNQGRMFDMYGMMQDWWSPAVARTFTNRTNCIRDQYPGIKVPGLPAGLKIDGQLTL